MSETPLADEVEKELVSMTVAGALWDDKPCCEEHRKEYWEGKT